jgi:desulfoferrodoxin (superoxide reductase-like protein)
MSKEHLIEWIYVEYFNGGEFVYLHNEPCVVISLLGRKAKKVYAYCNQHGLWVKELE